MTNVLLTPEIAKVFRQLTLAVYGYDVLPIMYVDGYRQGSFVDIYNTFGRGYNSIYSYSDMERSVFVYTCDSLEEYLTRHYHALSNNRFCV